MDGEHDKQAKATRLYSREVHKLQTTSNIHAYIWVCPGSAAPADEPMYGYSLANHSSFDSRSFAAPPHLL
jgi:hypothetical protein